MRLRSMAVLALLGAMISLSVLGTSAQWANRALVIYSGHSETVIDPIVDRFTFETGIRVEVRYGDTTELRERVLALDPGAAPDLFIASDSSALERLSQRGYLSPLPNDVSVLSTVQYRNHHWVGFSASSQDSVSAVAILSTSERHDLAAQFVAYLLSPTIQQYIAISSDGHLLQTALPWNPP